MIGKKEWFTTKRYFGWGLRPVTWQGWVYVGGYLAVLMFIVYQPFWVVDNNTGFALTVGWNVLFLADAIHIWVSLKGK